MTESRGDIYKLLAGVAGSLPAVPKAQEVDAGGQRYAYRGITDVVDTVHGPLAKAGITVVPEVLEVVRAEKGQTRSGTPTIHMIVRYAHTFYAPDGSSVRAVTLGEGVDTSDKACNKCHSAALKYALNEVLMIAYDLEEQDAERPEQPVTAPEPPEAPAPPAPPPPAAKPAPRAAAPAKPAQQGPPLCPECGTPMALRTRRADGAHFWGCPKWKEGCRGTLPT